MADEKKILTAIELPQTIQGDGRYVLSLLRKYVKAASEQINLANGFTQDDIEEESKGEFPRPKNFTLTFDRLGGVLHWDAVTDTNLAYYELRTTDTPGMLTGLLEKTTATSSLTLPVTPTGKIYLFAVSKEGKVSNAATITYTKRRPEAPSDISLTKNNEGTLITFLEIPTDCIGANLYIDHVKYQTVDNVYLYPDKSIKNVEIAYYDQFGEGERAYFSCEVPNVTGFWVEKNDANLYFYWDSLSIYNVTYVVKVGNTHEWENGVEIFRTKINKHRYIRPDKGGAYFMIKAMDEHGNYSSECTWYLMDAAAEINKNIVIQFDQETSKYSGNKINLYLDSAMNGLRLEKTAFNGEYIMPISLPQKIKARNWIAKTLNAVSGSSLRVVDCDFAVNSYEAQHVLIVGIIGDLDGVELKQQIARYIGKGEYTFSAITDGTANATGGIIAENKNASASDGRWQTGLLLTDVTQLAYDVTIPAVFSFCFWLKKTEVMTDCIILKITGTYSLVVGYDARLDTFYLTDTKHGQSLTALPRMLERDWVYIGLSQSEKTRLFFLYGLSYGSTASSTADIPPCGEFSHINCNPKEI